MKSNFRASSNNRWRRAAIVFIYSWFFCLWMPWTTSNAFSLQVPTNQQNQRVARFSLRQKSWHSCPLLLASRDSSNDGSSTSSSTVKTNSNTTNSKNRNSDPSAAILWKFSYPKYLRWKKVDPDNNLPTRVELQTAITTFQKGPNDAIVELHAQIHVADSNYFSYYNDRITFGNRYDAVLYELLLDQDFIENEDHTTGDHLRRRLKQSSTIQAANSDRALAKSYGWTCQADAIDYHQSRWYHADWTRQQFLNHLDRDTKKTMCTADIPPFWKLARRQKNAPLILGPTTPAMEAATALLVGPPILLEQRKKPRKRLFTNLFLPGDLLATGLRVILWGTVPSPELSILLLDWSSTWWEADETKPSTKTNSSNMNSRLSPIISSLLTALSQGRIGDLRKLVFGQVLVAGHNAYTASTTTVMGSESGAAVPFSDDSILIGKRNDHALQILENIMSHSAKQRVALLYGCNHCPDLHFKLLRTGYKPVQTQWRTVWSVSDPNTATTISPVSSGSTHSSTNNYNIHPSFCLLVPLYLVVGGADWIATWQDMARAGSEHWVTWTSSALFYLLRHVILYVGISKLVLDFGEPSNTMDE